MTSRADASYLQSAPVRFEIERYFAASPESIFDALADSPGWPDWMPLMRAVSWTSPEPHSVGATRQVVTHGGVVLDEEIIACDRPYRWGFTVTRTSVPFLAAAVEIAELTPSPDGGTNLRYRGGAEFVRPLRIFTPLLRWFFPWILERSFDALDRRQRQRQ